MSILATDPRVLFDREYPYEIRYLAYYAKLSSILKNRSPDPRFTSDHLYTFEESVFGPWPWHGHNGGQSVDWLRIFWDLFSHNAKICRSAGGILRRKSSGVADTDGEAGLALFCHRSLPRSARRVPFIQCIYEEAGLLWLPPQPC